MANLAWNLKPFVEGHGAGFLSFPLLQVSSKRNDVTRAT
jgi:hypothetical protein